MRRVRCSPIWPRQWLVGRIASTALGNAAAIANTSLVPRRQRPRCGGWSTAGSTPRICRRSVPPALRGGVRRGPPVRPRQPVGGCIWMSMPPSPSTIPITSRKQLRAGRRRSAITRCWCFWTAPRSPAGKHWPLCCVRGMRAATPPPTTSPCWGGRLNRCRRAIVGTRTTPAGKRFWCDPIPPVPATPSPAHPGRPGSGTPSASVVAPACRAAGVGYSVGYVVDARVQVAVEILNTSDGWYPAVEDAGGIREGAWVAEATHLVDLSAWPVGTRLILRKERPHPGAQLRFTDSDGLRVTAFITDTAPGVVPGQLAGLELRHRQHARVEDRIREAKATGLRNLPCHRFEANAAWLEIILAATDLVAWTKLISFTEEPGLAKCEIGTFRYRVRHAAARITRGARQIRLRIDATWRWATAITQAWQQLRAAFP